MTVARAAAPLRTAAVIDVGSNSALLLVLGIAPDGHARALDEALITTRLGAGLESSGRLAPEARARTENAVRALARRARDRGAERLWAFATGAARDATDGPAFARALGDVADAPVEVLSGAREAELAYAAAARGLGVRGRLVVADVGGRTTELGLGEGPVAHEVASLPLGALALTEAHLDDVGLCAAIDRVLGTAPIASARGAVLAASGGTATALAALDLGLDAYAPARIHGHRLACDRLVELARAPHAAGAVDAGRAAILPAGTAVLERLAAALGVATIVVSDHGVRHAYLAARCAECGVEPDLRALWP